MGDRDDKERQDEDLRLASGWGRREPKHTGHDWARGMPADASETADEEAGREDPPEDDKDDTRE